MLVLDNFRMGGIQRLALDQLYMLADLGFKPNAFFRQVELTYQLPNFLTVEKSRIKEKNLEINELPSSDIGQVVYFFKQIKKRNISLVINHSLGAAVILRMVSCLAGKPFLIKSFVHQLPSLSAPRQRIKRFAYALASHEIYGYSEAVVDDWNSRINESKLPGCIRKKLELKLHRNGVYLPRLPKVVNTFSRNSSPRLLFIGREVAWKNLNFLFELLRSKELRNFNALIVLPSIDLKTRLQLEAEFPNRVQFEIGKKIEDIVFERSDINIYPVNYGQGAKFIEAVSINCLEMACVGIPSLITSGGNQTWSELAKLGVLREVDWRDTKVISSQLLELQAMKFSEDVIDEAQRTVDIKNNLQSLLNT